MSEWTNIKEKGNPKKENDYLIFTNEGYQYVASWHKIWENKNHYKWTIRCECCNAEDCILTDDMVTHYMQLPIDPDCKCKDKE